MKRIAFIAALGAAVSTAAPSHAQDATPKKQAAELFSAARAVLVKSESHAVLRPGELDEACAKLEQSYTLIAQGHTMLNLAECHALQGKTATGWKEFGRAAEMARSEKFPEAEQAALKGAADLQPKLSFLTVMVAPGTAALPGFALTLNGRPAPRDDWSKAVPVDPGTFEIAAKADGYLPFAATSTVGPDGARGEVVVTLSPLPPAPPAPSCPPPLPLPPPRSHIPGYVAAAAGGAALLAAGISLGFFFDEAIVQGRQQALCLNGLSMCSYSGFGADNAQKDHDRALAAGFGAVAIVATGAAAVGLALELKPGLGSTLLSPLAGRNMGGIAVQGRF